MSEIENIDKLISKLNNISECEEMLGRALKREGLKVKAEAKLLCPVDTGELRNSILCSEPKGSKDKMYVEVYTNNDHACYVEFGTGQRGKGTNTNKEVNVSYREDWVGMKAQPYMYPALKNNEDNMIKDIAKDLLKQLRRVAKK